MPQKRIFILFLALLSLNFAVGKPFKRVMVLSGGEFRMAAGLGIIAEAIKNKKPWVPDLVIFSCGFALGGAYINALSQQNPGPPDPDAWFSFVKGDEKKQEYFELMKNVRVNRAFFDEKGADGLTRSQRLFALALSPNIPQIHTTRETSLVHVPFDVAPHGMNLPFSSDGIRVLFVSSKVLFDQGREGEIRKDDEKLYQETYFTDPLTEQAILESGYLKSDIAKLYPKSRISPDISFRSDVRLFTAARASLSEPYFLEPPTLFNKDGMLETYIAGAPNVSPIELAKTLGNEVMAVRMRAPKFVESLFFNGLFGFTIAERKDYIKETYGDSVTWIDLLGVDEMEAEWGFTPKRKGLFANTVLVDAIPFDDFSRFQTMAEEQWKWGRAQMKRTMDSR